jgi:hypothetical protein
MNSLGYSNTVPVILSSRHEIRVNKCLTNGQPALPLYPKRWQIFDFGGLPAYNAAPST